MSLCVKGRAIYLTDELGHSAYRWPLSRLSCRTEVFDGMTLVERPGGNPVPFQLSDETDGYATLHFLSGLEGGGRRQWELCEGERAAGTLKISEKGGAVTLDNGRIWATLPLCSVAEHAPPPILAWGMGDCAVGHGRLDCPAALTVRQEAAGDVFVSYVLRYAFPDGGWYEIQVTLTAGMEFLELEERMDAKAPLEWRLVCDGVPLKYRHVPNRPDRKADSTKQGYAAYAWEPVDTGCAPDGKLPVKIAPYHNWNSWWRLPAACFWDEQAGMTAGIFIREMERWDDGQYALWGSKDTLCIHFYHTPALEWQFPVRRGTRSLALAVYPHEKDRERADGCDRPLLYIDDLRRWHGWLPLHKVCRWVMDFPVVRRTPRLFLKPPAGETADSFYDYVLHHCRLLSGIPNATERSGGGVNPVDLREVAGRWLPAFEALLPDMTEQQASRIQAAFAFLAYICFDEALMPVRNMLAGHPNFLADVKGVVGLFAYLFPHHPAAAVFADHFHQSLHRNLHYHVRPDVPAWGARGGRWTENLTCYTWAFLVPSLKISFLLHHFGDGRNAMAHPNVVMLADWILHALTPPLEVLGGNRGLPPQGAHCRSQALPYWFRLLAQELRGYAPELAERILAAVPADNDGFEEEEPSPWRAALSSWSGAGLPLSLEPAKYTGYGCVIRYGAGNGELCVHLQQLDEGPNYRWGRAGKGGNGCIHYYAAGKRYTHIGVEDVGDDCCGDVERCTNFGVLHPGGGYRCIGEYRCVGRQDAKAPFYRLGLLQCARADANADAGGLYQYRMALVVENRYLIVVDKVRDASVRGRFSWFVGQTDTFPYIVQLCPGVPYVPVEGAGTKGRWYDGAGDFVTAVTHLDGISFSLEPDGWRAEFDHVADRFYAGAFAENNIAAECRYGMIRFDGQTPVYAAAVDAASFQAFGVSLQSEAPFGAGFYTIGGHLEGRVMCEQPVRVTGITEGCLYVDSQVCNAGIAPGEHDICVTAGVPAPARPQGIRTENAPGRCTVVWQPAAAAESYQICLYDAERQQPAATQDGISGTCAVLNGLEAGAYRVVVTAVNRAGAAQSAPYPLYIDNQPPSAPDGLIQEVIDGRAVLQWGEVLGVSGYRLYRVDPKGRQMVYQGLERRYSEPFTAGACYEVSAVNGCGEGAAAPAFAYWAPVPGEGFRRDTENHENGYAEYRNYVEEAMPVLRYPDKAN